MCQYPISYLTSNWCNACLCSSILVNFACCMYAVPGTPYFVEVQVLESIRGLGLPRQTGVFFSQETGEMLLLVT